MATVSEDASIFTPEKLAEFDAIVMNNCNELHLDEERSRALQDFVKNGKGVVGLGSTISIINWPEEAEMMGGYCFRHPFTGVPSNPKSTWALKIDDPIASAHQDVQSARDKNRGCHVSGRRAVFAR